MKHWMKCTLCMNIALHSVKKVVRDIFYVYYTMTLLYIDLSISNMDQDSYDYIIKGYNIGYLRKKDSQIVLLCNTMDLIFSPQLLFIQHRCASQLM